MDEAATSTASGFKDDLPAVLPIRMNQDPFLEFVYGSIEAESWGESRRTVCRDFQAHHELISRIRTLRYPSWVKDKSSNMWDKLETMHSTPFQREIRRIQRMGNDSLEGNLAVSEEEDRRLTQLVSEALALAATLNEHDGAVIDYEPRPHVWADAYNPYFQSFIFGIPQGCIPSDIVLGYEVPWRLRPHEDTIPVKPSDPSWMVVDLVISVSIPICGKLSGFARQISLEKCDYQISSTSWVVTVPWIIVEYVKFGFGGSDAKSIHQAHLVGAFEAALGLYKSLDLDLPLFGILCDRMNVAIYTASVVKSENDVDGTEIHYFQLAEFDLTFSYKAYKFCLMLDRLISHAQILHRNLKERLKRLGEGL